MSAKKCLAIAFLLIIIAATFFIGGSDNHSRNTAYARSIGEESAVDKILQGEHQLRKMITEDGSKSSINGGFFLIAGWINSKSENLTKVTFSWLMNDGTYAISSLPIEKIRIKFDETKDNPVIKFKWRPGEYFNNCEIETQMLMNLHVIYALVTCREKDWPTDITLPLNQEK